MCLADLLSKDSLDIDTFFILLDFKVKHLMAVVYILEYERVLQHLASAQLQEGMSSHVVGQVGHH